MKVKELITELQELPEDAEVIVRSYDNSYNKIEVYKDNKYPYLRVSYIDEYGNYLH